MKSRDVILAKITPTVLFPAPGIPTKTIFDLLSNTSFTWRVNLTVALKNLKRQVGALGRQKT